jgi:hypothetical protein
MKAKTAIRLYCVALIMLLGGWCINLVAALNRPTVDWRDAAGAPMLVLLDHAHQSHSRSICIDKIRDRSIRLSRAYGRGFDRRFPSWLSRPLIAR